MNRICNICKIKINENFYMKDWTVCKSCYNKNRRKNNNNTIIQNQQPKTDKINTKITVPTYENHAYVVIGRRNLGKTFYMLKVPEKIGNKRPVHIISRSPNQYPNYKTNNEIKPINKYKGSVVVFDNMLGARNSSQLDEFFTRGRHEDLGDFTLVRAILLYRDKVLEITVIN